MKHADQLWGKVLKLSKKFKERRGGIKILAVGVVILLISVLASGSVLVYSLKLKQEGDIEYKNRNYTAAMDKFQKAGSYWFVGAISSRLRDHDLETKIGKADVMIRSGQNYQDGIKEFESGNFDSAKYYFSRVALNDPNYSDAMEKTKLIDESNKKIIVADNSTNKPISDSVPPSPVPKTNQVGTYKYDDYYPIILKISDDRGNYEKQSNRNYFNATSTDSSFKNTNRALRFGDTIKIKVEASDPKGREILYDFRSNSNRFNSIFWNKYSTANEISYVINQEDLTSGGENFYIAAEIKSIKDFYRIGTYDDEITLLYKLRPD